MNSLRPSTPVTDESAPFLIGGRPYALEARTHVMGILNVTPDSFSDGGLWMEPEAAEERAFALVEQGADFVDVGGESSRPRGSAYGEGAVPVPEEEELRRVLPVIRRLAGRLPVPVSVDTTKSAVARASLDAGAAIINDISGLRADPAMAGVIAAAGAVAVVMHMRGNPGSISGISAGEDLLAAVERELAASLAIGRAAGVGRMMADPGIGFGKSGGQNLEILRNLRRLRNLGCPLLVGVSRKAFIGEITGLPVGERLEGSLAAMVAAILNGAGVVRVHDVGAAVRAARVADALRPQE